jgi:hypothetical protein
MAKMLFDLERGLIEVEGEETFVEKVYADLRSTLSNKVATFNISATRPAATPKSDALPAETSDEQKKRGKRPKTSGPSCPSRIEGLKAEDFFRQLRTSKEIGDKLREKGTAYEAKRIASALHNLTVAGKLRRIQEGGSWKYQNP